MRAMFAPALPLPPITNEKLHMRHPPLKACPHATINAGVRKQINQTHSHLKWLRLKFPSNKVIRRQKQLYIYK